MCCSWWTGTKILWHVLGSTFHVWKNAILDKHPWIWGGFLRMWALSQIFMVLPSGHVHRPSHFSSCLLNFWHPSCECFTAILHTLLVDPPRLEWCLGLWECQRASLDSYCLLIWTLCFFFYALKHNFCCHYRKHILMFCVICFFASLWLVQNSHLLTFCQPLWVITICLGMQHMS